MPGRSVMEKIKVKEIREKLLALQDKEYRDFQAKLIPTVDPERIIGTRTNILMRTSFMRSFFPE